MNRLVLIGFLLAACGRIALAEDAAPLYLEHQDLSYFLDARGAKHKISTIADWEKRRAHILANMQLAMGPLPDRSHLAPLEMRQLDNVSLGSVSRRKIEYVTEPGYTLRAYLFIPQSLDDRKMPAILCLHQTVKIGKEEPAGLGGNPNLHYALHLAQRGYVTLAPDYPSFGEREYDFDAGRGYVSGT
ncbi:MAG TPA: acetylxylan esterase, partial [Planctomycetaceae bacterium]|nr:acetylxylan esterase [Planctomycetaceae bacterium]